jgi:superfamily II DNA or RNA helicase
MNNIKAWKFTLRKWQSEAFSKAYKFYSSGKKEFLCVATPGAGKTIFGLKLAHQFLTEKLVDRIVIICPTEHLKKQWADAAFKFGLDLNPSFENSGVRETSDYVGAVLTYAQIGRAPLVHKKNCEAKRTFVIFDEIHHTGDNLSWGDGARISFEKASYRLGISGTPFRRDSNPIPFVKYVKGQSVADYTYGYTNALIDNVCRPIYFPAFEGEMEWRMKDKIFRSTFEELLTDEKAAARLKTALDPKGKWLKMVISDADKKLNEIRKKDQPDAGGLLIATDQSHARKSANLIGQITGQLPAIVISDDPNASDKIKQFGTGSEKWMVAVKMVSEGVDIPRLRVGVYATNVKSELFFRQAVGRFVRVQNNKRNQKAFLYIPKEYILVEHARQIEAERDHYLSLADKFDDETERKRKEHEIDEDRFEAIYSFATNKVQLELDFGAEFALPEEEESVSRELSIDFLRDKVKVKEEDLPVFEQALKLKNDINDLSKLLAARKGKRNGKVDWHFAHKEWIRIGGKSIEQETLEDLRKRKIWLRKQLFN